MFKKKKILYIHQDGRITGSAISLQNFLNALNRDLFETEILLSKDGPLRELYEADGNKVHVYNFHTFWTAPGPRCHEWGNFVQLMALFPNKKLRAFILSLHPDLIHINDKAALNVGISLRGSGIPIIQHSRSTYHLTACKLNYFLSRSIIRNYADQIIAISEDENDGFEDFKDLSIIFNTVDENKARLARSRRELIRAEFNISDDEIVIGMMAAVNASKGAWTFLEMASSLIQKEKDIKVKFLIVGEAAKHGKTRLNDGSILPISPDNYLKRIIENRRLSERILITGFRKDNLDVLSAMDILIVPNSNGVLGRQPLEAQAMGTPVIVVSGHSGKSSIIKNNITGMVISNKDTLGELIINVRKLLIDPLLRKSLSEAGLKYALENFSPSVNMRKIESIYCKLVGLQ